MLEVMDLTSPFTNVSFNISGFMSGINLHMENYSKCFSTTEQHGHQARVN